MEQMTVRWRKRALAQINAQLIWYEQQLGKQAAHKFWKGLHEAVLILSQQPQIGTAENRYKVPSHTIRSWLLHKNFRLLYMYNAEEIVILKLWDLRSIKR